MMKHVELKCPLATDGEIAAINLEGARRRAWARLTLDAGTPGVAEALVDMERMASQFLGDMDALDRLEALAAQFARADKSFRAALVQAEFTSAAHRFEEARDHLSQAAFLGAPSEILERQQMAIDQACGVELDKIVDARRRIAGASGRLEDLLPLGAALADLERFAEAETIYLQAFYGYNGVSPFPLAWTCFQLGMLWGELVPLPDAELATLWYRRAICYVPRYAKARVHLAEILASQGSTSDAEALLILALSSRDPEVNWRLSDVLMAQEKFDEAELQLDAARSGFEALLAKHPLAFADHGAEFYAGSGDDLGRALELARINVANRPTRRAIKQANMIAGTIEEAANSSRPRSRIESEICSLNQI